MRDWMEAELEPLVSGEILNLDLSKMEPGEVAAAYAYLQGLERLIEDRKKTLREELLTLALEEGHTTEKGGATVSYDNVKIIRERRVASMPEAEQVRGLLKLHSIDPEAVFSKKTTTVLDASKCRLLIDTGKLDETEFNDLKTVNLALKVYPSEKIEDEFRAAHALYCEVFEEHAVDRVEGRRARPKKDVSTGTRKGE